ncbi:hypothetical protein [Lysinibacillus sp. NPDC093692]|uniref:hypothetical protein n=1 Tax=Lysinibacillus sp. NPDC093692 TaxID=3390578 RepID=UPI003D01150D
MVISQKSRVEIIAEDATELSPLVVEANANPKNYLACIVKPPSRFYLVGEEYIITEPSDNGYYTVFLKCHPDNAPVGSYKTKYFDIIALFEKLEVIEIPVQKIEVEPEIKELPRDQWKQMDLFGF